MIVSSPTRYHSTVMTAPNIPTVADLSDRIYDVSTDGFDNVFREYFHGPDVVTDDWYFSDQQRPAAPDGQLADHGESKQHRGVE